MTFLEMRQRYDKYNAFTEFITVEQAEYVGLLPTSFHGVFPHKCICGSEMIINNARTKLMCCDPRCYIKQGYALSELFRRFNIKGIADATCSDVYQSLQREHKELISQGKPGLFETESFVEILKVPVEAYSVDFRMSAIGVDFMHAVDIIRNKVMTFPEMISKLGLPEMDTTAFKLFNNINSFEEFAKLFKQEGGVNNFCNNRGVYAPQKKFWFRISLEDIIVGTSIFANSIRQIGLQQMDICITGSLYYNGEKVAENSFRALCNYKSYTGSLSEIIIDALEKDRVYSIEELNKLSGKIGDIELDHSKDSYSYDELVTHLRKLDLLPVQILEVRMTSAKKSVPYILADVASNSAKYLEGLSRGSEFDEDGELHKVLITSNEFMEIVKKKVNKWEGDFIKSCKTILEKAPQEMTNF